MDCRVTLGIESSRWDSHEWSDDWYLHLKLSKAEEVRSERIRGRTKQDDARKGLGAKLTIDLTPRPPHQTGSVA